MKKGYAVVLLDVTDHRQYAEYAKRATEIEARYGGRALVAGEAVEVVDGDWPAQRTVVLEFPSIEHARAWYSDPDYRDLIPLRRDSTNSQVLLIEGFSAEY
jgi:uncharacterized protein (DUF1330 family)